MNIKSVFLMLMLVFTFPVYAQDEVQSEPIIQDVAISDDIISIPEFAYEPDWTEIWHFKNLQQEVDCLAKNIYWEGRLEPTEGQTAIALVTINRLKTQQYADSICKVVYQKARNKHHKLVAQFSWVVKVKNKTIHNIPEWEQCLALARKMLANASLNNVSDFTNGATYYHTIFVHPNWPTMETVGQYGLHMFFRTPDEARLATAY